ncbi:MAG: hypothetical protein QOE13_1530, partial [Gaiellaceae bacterium]|nr:hypothetical protein [Gaiellaceae bacterium]
MLPVLLLVLTAWAAPAAQAAGPSRILYSSDWAGPSQIFALDPSGRAPLRQATSVRPACDITIVSCGVADPVPSPDGRHLLFRVTGAALYGDPKERPGGIWLSTVGKPIIELAAGRGLVNCISCSDRPYAAWTRDSKRLAYVAADGLHVVRSDGSGDRLVDPGHDDFSPSWSPSGKALAFSRDRFLFIRRNGISQQVPTRCEEVSWSADGRWLACGTEGGFVSVHVTLLDTHGHLRADLGTSSAWPVWSPKGARLAFSGSEKSIRGIRVADARTLRVRTVTKDEAFALAWSPQGDRLAYIQGFLDRQVVDTRDLRLVTLAGVTRTLVKGADPYGSTITSLAWAKGPGHAGWSAAAALDGLHAAGDVTDLATSGNSAAYIACGRAYLWEPGTTARLFPPPDTRFVTARDHFDQCRPTDRERVDAVALGRNGALFAWCDCPVGGSSLQAVDLERWSSTKLGTGSGLPSLADAYGTLFADESLLAFSHWTVRSQRLENQRLQRVDGVGQCPCPVIAEMPGELEPLDVNQRRIVVRRAGSLAVLDASGADVLSLA